VDSVQQQKNLLFQNFMNNRLGFNLQARQYLDFMDTCQAHSADTTTSLSCVPGTVLQSTAATPFITGKDMNDADMRRTPDGGYIIAGRQFPDPGASLGALIKFNSAQQVQWAKTYSCNDGSDCFLDRMRVTSDNGYIALGATSLSTAWILKTDQAGNTLWQKFISVAGHNSVNTGDIVQTQDGGYAALLSDNSGVSMVIKTDNLGSVTWSKALSLGSSARMYARNLATSGDTILVSGGLLASGSDGKGVLMKLDQSNGNALGAITVRDINTTNPWSIEFLDIYPSPTGYKIHLGYPIGAMNLGFGGNVQQCTQFNFGGYFNGFFVYGSEDAIPTLDGGWVAGGAPDDPNRFIWMKVNPDGSKGWTTQTNLANNYAINMRIRQNPDSTFTGLSSGAPTALLINVSSTGTTGCYDSALNWTLTTPTTFIGQLETVGIDTSVTVSYSTPGLTIASETVTTSPLTCAGHGTCYSNYNGPLLCGNSAPLLPPVDVTSVTTCSDSTFFSVSMGTALYNTYADSLTGDFEQRYKAKCMQAYKHESFTVTHNENEYHYALYYYDQAGNLVKTVPPAGVQQNTDTNWIKQVETAKAANQVLVPAHTLVTTYRYNSLNRVIAQRSPDGGTSHFWYDRLGRIVISQNARQQPNNQYSYTQYDTINRIIQVGQISSSSAINDAISRSGLDFSNWMGNAMSSANQITVTTFDSASFAIAPELNQRNVRNRVSRMVRYDTASDLENDIPAAATYFSYDILGNIDTLVQDFGKVASFDGVPNSMTAANNRFKKIVYDFDLVSGKTNKVSYQQGYNDAFYHAYLYDAENRITNAQSSTDNVNWDNDVFYSYYAHGPQARAVLGQQQVQGINYAYTLQGWLKGINPAPYTGGTFTLRPDSANNVVANNAYNLLVNYFDGDFKPISGAAGPDSAVSLSLGDDYRPLFNGNISSMGVNIRKLDNPMLYNYQYDQLDRLIHMDAWKRTATPWSAITKTTDFQENIAYDPNGNIRKYRRNGSAGTSSTAMDSLNYCYLPGTNKLDHISDSVPGYCIKCNDITTQASGNYQYDSIGALTADAASGISNITWTMYGKISSITKAGDTTLKFTYDPAGHRISKTVIHAGDVQTTWYVRDVQGNILSVYTYGDPSVNGKDLTQTELELYGSSRLGIWKRNVDVSAKVTGDSISLPLIGAGDSLVFTRGNKLFELANHLGNVLATISDKRFGVSLDDSTVVYYNPDIVSANDYYPFGMLQPGRTYTEAGWGNYRFGFNGKENDNEVKGAANQQDYGMRIYDPRVGRFYSVDPIGATYPELTPYQFASNSPIRAVDLDGLEAATISFGGRVTCVLVTGSLSIGLGMDYTGSVKIYYQWSFGLGLGFYAGTGVSVSVYDVATLNETMGGGINLGGNVGLPGLSFGLDINASLQQDNPTSKVKDVRFGLSGGILYGVKPLNLGPGGAEVHLDYSYAHPLLETTVKDILNGALDKIRDQLHLTQKQLDNLIRYINTLEEYLRQKHYSMTNSLMPGTTPPSTNNYKSTPHLQQNPLNRLPHSTLSNGLEHSSSPKHKQHAKPYVAGQQHEQHRGQTPSKPRDYSYPH